MDTGITFIVIVALFTAACLLAVSARAARAHEVWQSLLDISGTEGRASAIPRRRKLPARFSVDLLILLPTLAGATLGVLVEGGASQTVVFAMIGLCFGYLVRKRLHASKREREQREIDFFVPLTMERIVMAAHAGLDVLSSVKTVLSHEERQVALEKGTMNPVCAFLCEVMSRTERGQSFEQALQEVAVSSASHSVRHAFLHLAMAHKEGGELIGPLRELSDATLLQYQETIEEDIAKMPVRATMPLIVTFTGLVILFITPPLMNVMDIATRAQVSTVSSHSGGRP